MRQHTAPQTPTLSQAIAITLFTLSLTACTTTGADTAPHRGDEPTTGSADTAPIDVHAPATFDPKDPNFKLFDPCTELSEENFRQAGLGKRSESTVNESTKFKYCSFAFGSERGFVGQAGIASNVAGIPELRKSPVFREMPKPGRTPDSAIVYTKAGERDDECSVAISTNQGLLDVTVVDFDRRNSLERLCAMSVELLFSLFPQFEGDQSIGTRTN